MLIDGRLLPSGVTLRTDVVVIGAGPAGITVAETVLQSGRTVVLLEAAGRQHRRADDDALRGDGTGSPFPLVRSRRRGFGGTSGHWGPETGLRVRPLDDIDFADRPCRPGTSWPFGAETLEPYYRRVHQLLDVHDDYRAASWLPADATPLAWPGGPELAMFQFADHDCFVRRFEPLVAQPNIDVVLHAPVRELVLAEDGSTIDRVEVRCADGNEFAVAARAVVVAAGGIDNARLLLASPGRGGSGVGNEHDNVGRWFMDHLSIDTGTLVPARPLEPGAIDLFRHHRDPTGVKFQPMLWLGGDRIDREGILNAAFWVNEIDPAYRSGGVGALRSLRAWYHGTPRPTPWPHVTTAVKGLDDSLSFAMRKALRRTTAERPIGLRIMTEQVPDRESRIRLSSRRDALGMPRVDLHWKINDADLEAVRQHQDLLARHLEGAGLGTIIDRFERDRATGPIMSNYHHLGATRMHPDPRRGVVDADSLVHGTRNLYVTGGSVFPTGGYLNPTLTMIALAMRLGDHLIDVLAPAAVRRPPHDAAR
jgi:choline dehydrogenase-like flavoprotein